MSCILGCKDGYVNMNEDFKDNCYMYVYFVVRWPIKFDVRLAERFLAVQKVGCKVEC